MKNNIQLLCIALLGVSLTACSSGLQSKSLSSGLNGSASNNDGGFTPVDTPAPGVEPEINVDTKAAEDAAAEAEQALAEAEAAISDLVDSKGNLKIFSSSSASQSEVEAQFIADKLEEVLDRVLEKLLIVPQTFDKARGQLASTLAKLDPNNPLHQKAIDKIMVLMKKLDDVQARVRTVTSMLADKIDFVVDKVDMLLAKLGSNPLTLILVFEVERVKAVVLDFKASVKAL